jgi:hypothetical protein
MACRKVLVMCLVTAAAVTSAASGRTAAASDCNAALVHYTPYPGGAPGLGDLPWVRGTSRGLGLVALLWYWPTDWRMQQVGRALIYPGGKAPSGANTKILWAFLSERAKRTYSGGSLVVRGTRLDGPGRTWQQFSSIAYAGQHGAPSFASIITLPSEGCWRLQLGTGGLNAAVVFEAASTP